MPEIREPKATAPLATALVVLAVLAPLLYVLSIGPAFWMVSRDKLPLRPYQAFYWPLLVACDHCRPLDKAVDWYVSCFVEERPHLR